MKKKHAIILGANGLVGSQLLHLLLKSDQYDKVTAIGRRFEVIEHPKLEILFIDFKDLHKSWDKFRCDDMFYCIGTTMAIAKKKSVFKNVEYDYCVNIAKIAHHNRVKQFLVISAKGANANSRIFYNKIKGEIEDTLVSIGFESLQIFRPALLLGKREEYRFLESVAQSFFKIINFALIGFLKSIKAMPAKKLAEVMLQVAIENPEGVNVYSNKQIHDYNVSSN
jgi:uncharacterized protein YbjT (DUF2867 family)